MNSDDVSYNFNIAKVLSILMVATGHYFGGILWIPTTFALFIFAFSSGLFTSLRYQIPFNKKDFISSKIKRLLFPLFVINVFLFVLFMVQQKEGIFTWQTLFSITGTNGLLMWFKISNPSPFGRGLWFFTLLLLYYVLFPWISMLNRKFFTATIFLFLSFIITTALHYAVPMGYMLWLTVFAFLCGSYVGRFGLKLPPIFCSITLLSSCFLMLWLNLAYNVKILNYVLMILSCISLVGFLVNVQLPRLFQKILVLSGCVIQIYFIHTYLFIESFSTVRIINYFLSLVSQRLQIVNAQHSVI